MRKHNRSRAGAAGQRPPRKRRHQPPSAPRSRGGRADRNLSGRQRAEQRPADPGSSVTIRRLRDGAEWYARANRLPFSTVDYARVVADPARRARMAALYLAAPDFDPVAVPAYEAFRTETADQFAFMTLPIEWGGLGLRVEVCRDDPYPTLAALVRDIEEQGRLGVWATSQCGNPHPLLSNDENDMFRAVHDVFGHAVTGRGFDPDGEEVAWCMHSQMYSLLARQAMTTETRGQNSVLVSSGGAKSFPRQKVCLLPPEFCDLATVTYGPAAGRRRS